MAHATCFVYLVSAVSGYSKNALGRGSTSSGHIKNLSILLLFRYLWLQFEKDFKITIVEQFEDFVWRGLVQCDWNILDISSFRLSTELKYSHTVNIKQMLNDLYAPQEQGPVLKIVYCN